MVCSIKTSKSVTIYYQRFLFLPSLTSTIRVNSIKTNVNFGTSEVKLLVLNDVSNARRLEILILWVFPIALSSVFFTFAVQKSQK